MLEGEVDLTLIPGGADGEPLAKLLAAKKEGPLNFPAGSHPNAPEHIPF